MRKVIAIGSMIAGLLVCSGITYGQYLGFIRGTQRGLFGSGALQVYTHKHSTRQDWSSKRSEKLATEPFVYILNGKTITNTRRVARILSRDNTYIESVSVAPYITGKGKTVRIDYKRQ